MDINAGTAAACTTAIAVGVSGIIAMAPSDAPAVRGNEYLNPGGALSGVPMTGGVYGDRYTDIGIMPKTIDNSPGETCTDPTAVLRNNVGTWDCYSTNPSLNFEFWGDDIPSGVTVTVGHKWHDPFLKEYAYNGAAPWYWYQTPIKILWTIDGDQYAQEVKPEVETNVFTFPEKPIDPHVTMTVTSAELPQCSPDSSRGVACPAPGSERPTAVQRVRFNK